MTDDERRARAGEAHLRRSRNGGTYHLATCRRVKNTVPWHWAEEQLLSSAHPDMTIAAVCAANGVHPCQVCHPDEHLARLAREAKEERTEA
jgi:hypothetical protein